MKHEPRTKEHLVAENEKLRHRISELEKASVESQRAWVLLRDSEAQYRTIVENHSVLSFRWLPDGALTYVNDLFCQYVGKSRRELLGAGITQTLTESSSRHLEPLLVDLKAQLTPDNPSATTEHQVLMPDGSTTWYKWTNRAIFDAEGHIIAFQTVGYDVSHRKEAETALRSRLAAEELATSISTRFINIDSKQLDSNINHALQAIAEMIGGDRAHLTLYSPDRRTIQQEYEWHMEGVGRDSGAIGRDVGVQEWAFSKLLGFSPISVSSLNELPPEAEAEKKLWQSLKIKSLIVLPLFRDNVLIGSFGLNSTRSEREWSDGDVNLLRLMGEILVGALARRQMEAELRHRLEIEELVAGISARFIDIEPGQLDALVCTSLEEMGKFTDTDRCYLSLLSDGQKTIEQMFEWVRPGTNPDHDACGRSLEPFTWLLEKQAKGEIINLPRAADAPPAAGPEKEFWEEREVLSVLLVPLLKQNEMWGMMGFSCQRSEKTWSDEDINILKMAGDVFVNVFTRTTVQNLLRHRLSMEELVARVSAGFINIEPDNVDNQIHHTLQIAGEFAGVDRSFLTLLSSEGTHFDRRLEWCAQGVSSLVEDVQGLAFAALPWLETAYSQQRPIVVSRLEDLPPEAVAEKERWQALSVKSLAGFPIFQQGSLVAILGFDCVHQEKEWSQHDTKLLQTVGEIVVGALARHQAEAELRESQAFLTEAQRIAHVGSWILDAKTEQLTWSPEVYRIFGIEPEDFLPTRPAFLESVHPEDREILLEADAKAWEDHLPFYVEHRIVRPDGQIRVLVERAEAFFDDQGQPARLIGTVQDATELAKAQEDLTRERNMLRALIDNMPDPVYSRNVHGQYVLCNRAITQMLGLRSPDDALGKTMRDVYPPQEAALFEADDRQVLESGLPLISKEVSVVDQSSGRQLWQLVTKVPLRGNDGNIMGLVGINRDITELKAAEEALRYRLTIEELITIISTRFITASSDRVISETNQALKHMAEITGIDRVYYSQLSEDNRTISHEYEWYSPGLESHVDQARSLSIQERLPWLMHNLRERQTIHVSSLADLPPEASLEKQHWQGLGVQSVLIMPVHGDHRLYGLMGFDSHLSEKSWAEDDVRMLAVLSEVFLNVSIRREAEESIQKIHEELEQIVRDRTAELWETNLLLKQEIAEREQAEAALSQRLTVEEVVTAISKRFISVSSEHTKSEIEQALQQLADLNGADRVYLDLLSGDASHFGSGYEWAREGIPRRLEQVKKGPLKSMEWYVGKLERLETVHVPCIADLPPEAGNEKDLWMSLGAKSLISIPLSRSGKLVGHFGFSTYRHHRTWPDETSGLLGLVGEIFLNAIARKQAQDALNQRNRELEQLYEIGQRLSTNLDLEHVLDTISDRIELLVNVEACLIWLLDEKTGELGWRQTSLPHGMSPQKPVLEKCRSLAIETLDKGLAQTSSIPALSPTPASANDEDSGRQEQPLWSIPLQSRRGTIGVLQAITPQTEESNLDQQGTLELMSNTAALAIQNAQLYEQAQHDSQTNARLLNEVNHRVKNNLSSIIGLLYSEKRYAAEHDQAILDNLINRFEGLATVHSMLSESKWEALSLSKLAAEVIDAASNASPHSLLAHVDIPASPVHVSAKLASSMALIINELVTNSVKHAQPEEDTLSVAVHISSSDDTVLFEYRDNGRGYPPHVLDMSQHNVGIYLIQNLVRFELQGILKLNNDGGAVTTIQFDNRSSRLQQDSNSTARFA